MLPYYPYKNSTASYSPSKPVAYRLNTLGIRNKRPRRGSKNTTAVIINVHRKYFLVFSTDR